MSNVLEASLPDSGSGQGLGPAEAGEVCIANISPRERLKRLRFGVISFAVGLAVLAVLMAMGASRWWRLVLLLFFQGGTSGFFQWRDKT